MSRILIIRFSALGDVAMTIPVIYSLAKSNPALEIVVLSAQGMKPLFEELPENLRFIGADLKGKHKGLKGLIALYKELSKLSFDAVADFHGVLRSAFLTALFRMAAVNTATIDKGRTEKKRLTQQKNKKFEVLSSSFSRYRNVLERLGFSFDLKFQTLFETLPEIPMHMTAIFGNKEDKKWIGIAPFAKHKGKIYPMELQEIVISHFAADSRVKVFVFGGGKSEKMIVDQWVEKYGNLNSMVGKLDMHQELVLMSKLDVMLSMDSANMHLASLVGTTVVSVWGATHPFAGFMGWNQSFANALQTDLECRPCSVYGQKPCFRTDYACLYGINPQRIIHKIESLIFDTKHLNPDHND